MTFGINRGLIAGIVLVILVTLGNSVLALRNVETLRRAGDEVRHAQQVLEAVDDVRATATDAETGQRGYILTGDTDYLTPYYAAGGAMQARLRELDSLTVDTPDLHAAVPLLRHAIDDKMAELHATVDLRANEGFDAAMRLVATGRGKADMDTIRARTTAMIALEDGQLHRRTAQATRSRDTADSALTLAGLIELATLATVAALVRSHLRARERAAATLHAQKEQFRVTLGSIGDAVITTDTAARVTYLNPVAETLTAWPAADANGVALPMVFHIINESTRLEVANPALRALDEGAIVGLANHTLLVARDGVERPIDDSAAPIRDQDGNITGAVLVFRDVTERRHAERQLQDADQRKDEFLAVLAHELRNPLAPLRNALEVLRLSQNDPGAVERVGSIMERQLQQMVHLIDDLLDISRITRNRLELRRDPIDISAVVHGALETCGPALHQAGHALKLTLPPQPVYVDADRTRMAQAVGNVLSNAIKYTPPGGRIWLTVEREGSDAVVSVRDSGIGLPADMLDQIFDMFTQVDRSLERTQGGLGIGLPLVKHIIEMHGGSIRATSGGPGKGSEFVLRLPTIPTSMVPTPRMPDVVRRAARARRIVVADDNVDNADSLAMVLRVMGHEVRVTHDGDEALRQVEQFRPDIALLDIGMPKMNGYDTARALRDTPWGRSITLVALTGWGQEDDRRRSREAGFDHHMVKPVEIAALEAVLNDLAAST